MGKEEVDLCSVTAAAEHCKLKNCFGSETALSPTRAAVLFCVSGSYDANITSGVHNQSVEMLACKMKH